MCVCDLDVSDFKGWNLLTKTSKSLQTSIKTVADSGFLKGGLQYSAHEILEATPILVVFETNYQSNRSVFEWISSKAF